MQCQEIIDILEMHSPANCALEWDNVGLLAGRREKEVHKIMVALDVTDAVIEQAVAANADMLLTHHPLLRSGEKSITTDNLIGRRMIKLIQNDISYYAMHTSFDVRGMAELSEQKLKLQNTRVLEVTSDRNGEAEEGIGRVGMLPKEMTLTELAEYVKQQFELDFVRVSGDKAAKIQCVAVSGGSGKSMVAPAMKAGADVLVSGDLDHHTVLDAMDEGLLLIDAGHYGTEKMFVPYMVEYLKKKCSAVEVVEIAEKNPYTII